MLFEPICCWRGPNAHQFLTCHALVSCSSQKCVKLFSVNSNQGFSTVIVSQNPLILQFSAIYKLKWINDFFSIISVILKDADRIQLRTTLWNLFADQRMGVHSLVFQKQMNATSEKKLTNSIQYLATYAYVFLVW